MSGLPNYDAKTGIHYGVISNHSMSPEAFSDIQDKGENLTYNAAKQEARNQIADALRDVLDNLGVMPYVSKYSPTEKDKATFEKALNDVVDEVWDVIEQDWNDQYENSGDDQYEYTEDGYTLLTTSLGVYVCKSPYYTSAAPCSPCAPNAGDLNTPRNGGLKTYALGLDWFDDYNPCPYADRLFKVDDDTQVIVPEPEPHYDDNRD